MEINYSKIQIEGGEITNTLHNMPTISYPVIEDIEKLKEEFTKTKKLRKKDLWKSGGFNRYGRRRR